MSDPPPLEHGPLDALLRCLDEESSDNDDENMEDIPVPMHDESQQDQEEEHSQHPSFQVQDDLQQQTPSNQSQTPRRRRRGTLANYFSSPTARQQRLKISPCMFCDAVKDVHSLRDHLERSSNCRHLYFSLLHVSSTDGVMCKTFKCLFCNEGGNYLRSHLNSSNACFNGYCIKFKVTTIK